MLSTAICNKSENVRKISGGERGLQLVLERYKKRIKKRHKRIKRTKTPYVVARRINTNSIRVVLMRSQAAGFIAPLRELCYVPLRDNP
jgi:hypothetical protein